MDPGSRSKSPDQVEFTQESVSQGNVPIDYIVLPCSELHTGVFLGLSTQDRLLSPLIFVTMIIGIVIGEFCPNVQHALDIAHFNGVSVRQ
jgi:hypothetical protein